MRTGAGTWKPFYHNLERFKIKNWFRIGKKNNIKKNIWQAKTTKEIFATLSSLKVYRNSDLNYKWLSNLWQSLNCRTNTHTYFYLTDDVTKSFASSRNLIPANLQPSLHFSENMLVVALQATGQLLSADRPDLYFSQPEMQADLSQPCNLRKKEKIA